MEILGTGAIAPVFDAYGWDPSMTDEQILAALLKLNLERSPSGDAPPRRALSPKKKPWKTIRHSFPSRAASP